ncbi:hypothetical protein [Paraflavitalea speifideaquila]|uniref:hypothetical protein n=1 Tax=Paraflavitalea speifideaquila TaxID=3076558 RepID=UPI0028EDC0CD|nr:hypothetical protein [Paraflavitalea speifideiaquila]
MNRPKLIRADAVAYIQQPILDEVFLIGVRGYYQNTMDKSGQNDRGIYDDCICLVEPNIFIAFNANTDPWVFRADIATLIPGKLTTKMVIIRRKAARLAKEMTTCFDQEMYFEDITIEILRQYEFYLVKAGNNETDRHKKFKMRRE